MSKKQALGRGLSVLLQNNLKDSSNKTYNSGNIFEVPLQQINANPFQPRTKFKEEAMNELAKSIRKIGVIQPITIRKNGVNSYQIISGERRFIASNSIGMKTIPAYIRTANDREMLEFSLIENIQREDLDAIEIALTYQRMAKELNLTQEEISDLVGKKRSTITNYLRLLKLDPIIQSGIRDEMISMGHGRAIVNIDKKANQLDIYERVIKKDLSVRQTEELVRKFKLGEFQENKNIIIRDNSWKDRTKFWQSKLNSPVKIIQKKGGRGFIQIYYDNQEDLNRIQNSLLG